MKKLAHYSSLLAILLCVTVAAGLLSGWSSPPEAGNLSPENHKLRLIVPTNTPPAWTGTDTDVIDGTFDVGNGTFSDGSNVSGVVTTVSYAEKGEDGRYKAVYLTVPDPYIDILGNPFPNPLPAAGDDPYEGFKEGAWHLMLYDPWDSGLPWEDCWYRFDKDALTGGKAFMSTNIYNEDGTRTQEFEKLMHPILAYMYEKEVTFKVEGGTWDDGTAADQTVILNYYNADSQMYRVPCPQFLRPDQIPAAGNSPAEHYKEGSWKKVTVSDTGEEIIEDIAPDTETEIAEAEVTYIYAYKEDKISYDVTFKVENGAWDDGTTGDKTVTVWRYPEEDKAIVLLPEDVPAVGTTPDEGFKKGSWDTEPDTETEVSENLTYTYTYAPKKNVSYDVTFKVENGSWDDGTANDVTVQVSGEESDVLKLSADQIPMAGKEPAEHYKEGAWDTVPDTESGIKGNTAYTYSYAPKEKITRTVTFKVRDGSWNDGKENDLTVILTGEEGDVLKLSADQIPAAGKEPAEHYVEGAWDIEPDTETEIGEDVTYTYSYAEKEKVSRDVTFKVENGSWDDGTADERSVTVTGYEGEALKLSADQIPAVGSKPAEHYKAGSWDTRPDTKTEIAEGSVFTYSYIKKEKISRTVTFKVKNGAWDDGTAADRTVTLTGEEGDALKLSADQIPAAGKKPADGFSEGSWNTAFDTNTEIETDITYIYTFAKGTIVPGKKMPHGKYTKGKGDPQSVKPTAPNAPQGGKGVNTGDDSSAGSWAALMASAVLFLVLTAAFLSFSKERSSKI